MSHHFSGAFIDRLRAKIFIESGRAIPRPITGFEHCLMILLIFATSLNSSIAAVELLWASFGLWVGNGETEYLGIFTVCFALNSGLWSVGTLALVLFAVALLWPAFLFLQDAVAGQWGWERAFMAMSEASSGRSQGRRCSAPRTSTLKTSETSSSG
ncbi:hypothetical protein CF326_g10106, partial [Tilletia indica]